MSSARKGLKRSGMRSYLVSGPYGNFTIERVRHGRYRLRQSHMPPQFFNQEFSRLGAARAAAEAWAGIIAPPPSRRWWDFLTRWMA